MTEEAPGTGNGQGHGTKFPQYTMPFCQRDPFLRQWDFVKELVQAFPAMWREFQRALDSVHDPTEDVLPGCPRSVTF